MLAPSQLWNLLPEKVSPELAVPEWPQFLRGCLRSRESLDLQLPNAPRVTHEFEFRARPDDSQDADISRNSMKPPFTEETGYKPTE